MAVACAIKYMCNKIYVCILAENKSMLGTRIVEHIANANKDKKPTALAQLHRQRDTKHIFKG